MKKIIQFYLLTALVLAPVFILSFIAFDLQEAYSATVCFPQDGCTGTSTRPLPGQILIGNASRTYNPAYITPGTNITISTSSGGITINSSGGGGGSGSVGPSTSTYVAVFNASGSVTGYASMVFDNATGKLTVSILDLGSNSTIKNGPGNDIYITPGGGNIYFSDTANIYLSDGTATTTLSNGGVNGSFCIGTEADGSLFCLRGASSTRLGIFEADSGKTFYLDTSDFINGLVLGLPKASGTLVVGTGIAGRCAEWSATSTLTTAAGACGTGGGITSINSATSSAQTIVASSGVTVATVAGASNSTTTVGLNLNPGGGCSATSSVSNISPTGTVTCSPTTPSTTIPTSYVATFNGATGTVIGVNSITGNGCVALNNTTGTIAITSTCLSTSTNLTVANFATSSISQFNNDAGFVTSTGILRINGATSTAHTIVASSGINILTTVGTANSTTTVAVQITATSSPLASDGNGMIVATTSNATWSSFLQSKNVPLTMVAPLDAGASDWYGRGTVVHDTSTYVDGSGSLKLITLASSSPVGGRVVTTSTVDLSRSSMTYFVRSDNWASTTMASILIASDVFSNYYEIDLKNFLVNPPNNEWIPITFTRSNATANGSPNWAGVTNLLFRAAASTNGSTTVWFDGFASAKSSPKPYVSIVFDDGWAEQATLAKPIMDAYGIAGTAYVISQNIGTAGYMTQPQVNGLAIDGWDISGHGNTALTSLTSAQVELDLWQNKMYLAQNGFKGANNYALPNGRYNSSTLNLVRKYFGNARTIDSLANNKNYVIPNRISAFSPASSTPTSTLKSVVDNAVANNDWAIITFHHITTSTPVLETDYSTSSFAYIVSYIASLSAIESLPVSDVLADITPTYNNFDASEILSLDSTRNATTSAAGRSLTLGGGSLDVDSELYTKSMSVSIGSPSSTTDSAVAQHVFAAPVTLSRVVCADNTGTSTIRLDRRTSSTPATVGTQMIGALTCGSSRGVTTTFAVATSTPDFAINFNVSSTAGTPGNLWVQLFYTIDD